MSTEAVITIGITTALALLAMTASLVGVIYANLQRRIAALEQRVENYHATVLQQVLERLTKLETKLETALGGPRRDSIPD